MHRVREKANGLAARSESRGRGSGGLSNWGRDLKAHEARAGMRGSGRVVAGDRQNCAARSGGLKTAKCQLCCDVH